jgi:hypothetical protein
VVLLQFGWRRGSIHSTSPIRDLWKTLIFVQVQGRRSRFSGINRRNTWSILRINPPKFGGGLKFEPGPRGIGSAFHRAGRNLSASGGLGKKGLFAKVSFYPPIAHIWADILA